MERADIVEMRHKFLKEVKRYREAGYEIVYTDESWINENCFLQGTYTKNHPKATKGRLSKELIPVCKECGIYHHSGNGRGCILIDAVSESGFVPNAGVSIISGRFFLLLCQYMTYIC